MRQDPPSGVRFDHRPSLDGIRAIAALLVLLFHAGTRLLDHGYVGVDVFFVLSGFLITSLLVRELVGTGRLSFIEFYARRARRLLPAALGVLLVTAIAYQLIASPVAIAENRGGFMAAALYYSNWFFLAQSRDYFAEDAHPSPVQHYWSLSVEEQFYLAWPVLVLALVVLARRSRLRLDVAAAGLALAGLVYAGILAAHEPMASYFGTPARAYQLLIGATIALLCLRWETAAAARGSAGNGASRQSAGARAAGALLAAAGLALLLGAGTPWLGNDSAYLHGVAAALGAGVLILGLELAPASATGRGLAWRPAQLLGRWSYAIYLWHWPVIILGDDAGVLPGAWLPRTVVVVAVTVLLSAGTFYAVERPTQRITLRTFPRRRLVAVCGIATAVAAALACSTVLRIDAQAQAVLKQATAESTAAVIDVPQSGGHAPTVLLVGDSHARALYPGLADLAKEQGWSLVPVLEDGCPWPRVDARYNDGRPLGDCDQFRAAALHTATRRHPDVALLVSRSIVRRPLQVGDELLRPGDPGWLGDVTRGTERFLADLRPLVGHVVISEPLAETRKPMIECLTTSEDPESCSAPAIDAPGTVPLEAFWRSIPGVTTVSLDELVCPHRVCPAVVDGVVTHRDTNHLTAGYARLIAPALDEVLRRQGVVLARGKTRSPA